MKLFARIYFTVFITLLAGMLLFTVHGNHKKEKEKTALSFRSAVTRLKSLHGSSTDYFVYLSNGASFLFTVPHNSMHVGDSVIKVGNQKYFTVKRHNGTVVYRIGLNGSLYQ